uniref:Telomerase reverse transcriptase n=1 Tax=Euplotes aediculatus TaxID=5940 RepID=TERT_EUPAE|nr:RecName: Full=Telomerase reverse transcriptase; AltName: Full=Telomerase catalytic subunit; AltName: Full=Telomerase subunit P123 [Euplotes aediculatus]AAC47515.1 telomerase subunit p123 [Euplotes aediculatus]
MEVDVDNQADNHGIHSALKTCEEIKEAKTLYSWIQKVIRCRNQSQSHYKDLEDIKIFAQTNIVATPRDYNEEDFKVIARKEVFSTGLMIELIDKCLVELLSSSDVSDRQKLQCFGFQLKGNQLAKTHLLTALSTQKQYFFQDEWNQVRAMIGNELFRHLYTKYLIFQRTSEGTLVQFCGNNVFDHLKVNDKFDKKQKGGAADMNEPRCCSTCKYNVKNEKDHFLNNINVPNWNNMKSRTRIFYCTHFNRNNQFFKKHEFVSNKNNISAMDRAQTIFTNIFRFNRIRKKLKDKVIEKIAYMLEKVKDFNFNYYLTKSCPLPENWRERKQKIENLINKTREEKSKYYEELFSYTTDNKCVTQFINEFFYNILPKDFLTGRNRKNFQKKVKKYVELNKHELIHKNLLLEKINTREISWMQVETSAKHFYYFDHENIYVLWKLLRWIFEDLVVSLIRCFFYVTEQQKSYSKTYYYRKNIWDVIMKMSIADLKKETLAEVQEKEVEEWKKSLGFAPGKLRLIPKKTTFRPIMTFNKKIVNSDRKTTKLTTNTKLLNSHLMLKTLKNRMFKDPFGFAVFNYDDVMKKYEEFVCKWKQVGQPKLFFATMDIEKCYDSVNREKLSTFLKTTKLLSSDFWIMTAQILKRKNNIVIDSKNFRKKEMKDYFRQKFQKIALEGGQYPTLFSVLENEQNDLNAKKTLIVEAKQRNYFKKDNLLQPVINICQYNYINFNGKFYKQTKGIPQGLCVSSILSSFYYATLEESSLGFLRDESMNPENPNVNLLMRLTDDYLLITTQENNAVLFIEKLINVSRENGFKFNMKKLQTSFPLSPSKFAKYGMDSVEEQNIVQDYCDWIGISIDMKTLALMPNINLRIEGILCTLNLNMQTKKASMWLKKKLKSFLMNNITHYFRKTITTEDFANKTLNKLFISGGYKYMQCAKEYKDHFKKNLAMSSMIDLEVSKIIYSVTRAFFKYLVCNIKDTIFGEEHYPDFFLSTLKHFIEIFSTKKYIFNRVCMILKAKEAKLKSDQCQSLIQYDA